jgi:hypothetical protein
MAPAPYQKLRFFDHITSFSPHKESKVHTQKEKKNGGEKKKKKTELCMHSTKVQTLNNSLKVLQELLEACSVCAEFPFASPYDL